MRQVKPGEVFAHGQDGVVVVVEPKCKPRVFVERAHEEALPGFRQGAIRPGMQIALSTRNAVDIFIAVKTHSFSGQKAQTRDFFVGMETSRFAPRLKPVGQKPGGRPRLKGELQFEAAQVEVLFGVEKNGVALAISLRILLKINM